MATVIGVVSGVLTIFSFLQDNFANNDPDGSSKVRFAIGLDGNGLSNAGGDLPDIRVFNEVGGFLGARYDPGYVGDGRVDIEVKVDQPNGPGQQPTYALFSANDDAVCIAYLAQTWPDNQRYGWVGSWGRMCGATWYYSNIYIDDKQPDCMWIDKNGDQPVTGFQVHFPEFNDKGGGYNGDVNYYCNNAPPFNLYYNDDPSTITHWTRKFRRSEVHGPSMPAVPLEHRQSRVYGNDTRLVTTNKAYHSAKELCEDDRSIGPDLVNVAEALYCNMRIKTVFPVCSKGAASDCFDLDSLQILGPGLTIPFIGYSQVLDWVE